MLFELQNIDSLGEGANFCDGTFPCCLHLGKRSVCPLSGSGGPILEKREKWRTPSYFASMFKDDPRYTSHVDVSHPPHYLR
jgi:hypothetical protein